MAGNPVSYTDPLGLDPVGEAIGSIVGTWGGRIIGGGLGTLIEPGGGTIVGGVAGGMVGRQAGRAIGGAIGDIVIAASQDYEPGFVDAIRGAKDWGKRNGVGNAVDIFHEIKKGDRGRPGSKAGDNCSVNPETGDVKNGVGEDIGNLGDGY